MPRLDPSVAYGLMNPTYAGKVAEVGEAVGMLGGKMRQERIAKEQAQAMAGMSPLEQIKYAQQNVAKTPQEQLALSSKLTTAQTDAQKQQVLQKRRGALEEAARAIGNDALAERIQYADHEELSKISKEIREVEMAQIGQVSPEVRKQLLKERGYTDAEIADMNLRAMKKDRFDALLDAKKADTKAFKLNGETQILQVNDAGMVKDPESQSWVAPSALGLEEAPPQVQKIMNLGNEVASELVKEGTKNFSGLYEDAKTARGALISVGDSLPLVKNMYTGAFAEQKLAVARYLKAFGLDLGQASSIVDTEEYIATAGKRVADFIKNLGSGTGLSDADRQYALQVSAGDIEVDAEGLERLLRKVKRDAQYTMDTYNKARSNVQSSLPEGQQGLVDAYFPAVAVGVESAVDVDMQTYLPN